MGICLPNFVEPYIWVNLTRFVHHFYHNRNWRGIWRISYCQSNCGTEETDDVRPKSQVGRSLEGETFPWLSPLHSCVHQFSWKRYCPTWLQIKNYKKGKKHDAKQKCGLTYFLVVDITMEDMAACIHPESSHGPRWVIYAHSVHQWEPWINDQTYKPTREPMQQNDQYDRVLKLITAPYCVPQVIAGIYGSLLLI